MRADFVLADVEGNIISSGYRLDITRQSGNAQADATWNTAMATRYPDGIPSALYFQFSDVPENGAVYIVAASRQVPDGTSYTTYTTSASFVLSRPAEPSCPTSGKESYSRDAFSAPFPADGRARYGKDCIHR